MTINSETHVLEWSQRSNTFHVQPLERTLAFNRKLYGKNQPTINDWRILLVGSKDDCLAAAEASRGTLQSRESRAV